ncbi:MAG: ATP-dependent Clp protease ATP-binding subunit ClpX [Verrucomicrobiales bacterium]|jgi:ATP-dependent Clp protease ATP-binding subunit ClpX
MSEKDDPPPSTPTPEEISKQLSEFMKNTFPGAMAFTMPGGGTPGQTPKPVEPEGSDPPLETEEPEEDAFADIYDFSLRPRDIKAHLDRFVIKQDEAKKVLSIAVCDHYNHAKFLRRLEEQDSEAARKVEFAKQNVIVVGPTGVGKTYLIKHIAEMIGVPFVKADATKFSETGYVGGDVDDLVRELVKRADGDVDRAEYGIVYIDEVDKLATRGDLGGRDVSGRGVQTTLLKLMEETEVQIRNPMDIQSQMQAMFDMQRGGEPQKDSINTRHILFIVSGAFSGLQKVVSKRLRDGQIGFGAEVRDLPLDNDLFRHVTTQDFLDFGFEAEFIGRLPVRVVCEQLKAEDLFKILHDSEGSLIRQYERDFEAFGIRAAFDDSALHAIAELAATEETGARGLVTVCERLLRDFKFELPGTSISELNIDAELVKSPREVLDKLLEDGGNLVDQKTSAEAAIFSREFSEKHGVEMQFDNAAIQALDELARADNVSALQVCSRLFRDYQFGLKLIQKNTGRDSFLLPAEAVADPDKYLSGLVVDSYQPESSVDATEN